MAVVGEHDAHAGIQEGELAQAMLEGGVVEFHHREGLGRRQEGNLRPALSLDIADDGERRDRVAVGEFHEMDLAVAVDAQPQPSRQRVDDGHADAVQTARHLVGVLVEFPARMELGHDDFRRRDALARMDVGRNAAPVVGDGARSRRR